MPGSLRVTQVKSTISHIERNRATIRALGLKRIGDTVVLPDNAAVRGMVRQVRFLVRVEESTEAAHPGARRPGGRPSQERSDAAASDRSEDPPGGSGTGRRARPARNAGDGRKGEAAEGTEERAGAPASQPAEDAEEKA